MEKVVVLSEIVLPLAVLPYSIFLGGGGGVPIAPLIEGNLSC